MESKEGDSPYPKERINYKKVLKLLKSLILPYRKTFIALVLIFSFATFLRISSPIIVKHIIDNALKRDTCYFITSVCVFLFVNILFFIISYFGLNVLIRTGQKVIYELKNKLYSHVILFDIDYFSENNPGRLASRIQNDVNSVYEIFSEFSLTIFIDIIIFFGIFGIMYYHNKDLTIVIFPIILLIFIFILVFIKKSQSLFVDVRKKIAELTSFISEIINMHPVIRINRAEQKINNKFDLVNYEKFLKTIAAEYISIFFFLTIILFDPITKSLIFGYGGIKVLNQEMTTGMIVMFILYIGQLFEPLFRFSDYVSIIQKSFASVERINRMFEKKPEIVSGDKFLLSFEEIEFRDVWMRYPNSNWVLKGLSFKLKKGKTLAIVGRTGEGKTTIANLIFRFYDYEKGSILINGIELKEINIESLRSKIGLVQQDISLFPVSLIDNLRLMDENIPIEKINHAIKTLNLEDFYSKMNLNMEIKEKGLNLSTGQKQIISITRTLLLDQELIILDEATSNIDPYTENLITNAIKNLMKYKTLIIIAHRLSTIKSADYIGFLKDGRFVEFGTHDELMQKKGEYYNFMTHNK